MNFNEIQELINLVNKSNLTDFKLKDKDFEIQIRTKKYYKGARQQLMSSPQVVHMSQSPLQESYQKQPDNSNAKPEVNINQSVESDSSKSKNIFEIKSPIVGTFYRSPGADKPPFTKVGDPVKQGDVVCIIEAMKLFNEIESDITGTIVKVLVEDASPVEYDQVLFLVEI
ncbi:MAG: acetyl-CoA carboxylase biotin carboxyl carrier protein [Saprospiraceae bacterium]|nr:acetyl-CoA carboxylase biotin carboxyl carrier protein [Saprospiraceae bacterium]